MQEITKCICSPLQRMPEAVLTHVLPSSSVHPSLCARCFWESGSKTQRQCLQMPGWKLHDNTEGGLERWAVGVRFQVHRSCWFSAASPAQGCQQGLTFLSLVVRPVGQPCILFSPGQGLSSSQVTDLVDVSLGTHISVPVFYFPPG